MLVDIGNSRIKWCWQSKRVEQQSVTAISHEGDNAIIKLQQVLLKEQPKKLILVHVLGDAFNTALTNLCVKLSIILQLITSSSASSIVTHGYDQPEQLGADRYVALHGAVSKHPSQACIVIDCGTAVTIDLIDEGQHLGGVILPGMQLWLQSLIQNTQALSQSADYSKQVLARNTTQGISWGCINGLSGAIESIAKQMEDQCSKSCQRILCGGDGEQLLEYLQQDTLLQSYLVLQGLQYFSGENN